MLNRTYTTAMKPSNSKGSASNRKRKNSQRHCGMGLEKIKQNDTRSNSENCMNEQEQVKQIACAEAMRNMATAQGMLQKIRKEDHRYTDPEHARIACGVAYSGVLAELNTVPSRWNKIAVPF